MKEIRDRLFALRSKVGTTGLSLHGDALDETKARLSNLEDAVTGLIDIMVEACEEHED